MEHRKGLGLSCFIVLLLLVQLAATSLRQDSSVSNKPVSEIVTENKLAPLDAHLPYVLSHAGCNSTVVNSRYFIACFPADSRQIITLYSWLTQSFNSFTLVMCMPPLFIQFRVLLI